VTNRKVGKGEIRAMTRKKTCSNGGIRGLLSGPGESKSILADRKEGKKKDGSGRAERKEGDQGIRSRGYTRQSNQSDVKKQLAEPQGGRRTPVCSMGG